MKTVTLGRGAFGGMTAGINRRIKALGLNKDIEQAVLNAVSKRKSKPFKLLKMPRRVVKRICLAVQESGAPAVVCKGIKTWTVMSVESYINKTARGAVNLAKYNERRMTYANGHANSDKEIVSKLMTAGV